MRVVAHERGFDGVTLREPGEEFDAPKDAKGQPIEKAKWYKKVEPKHAGKTSPDHDLT